MCPGVDRERVVDMHNGILFSHKKRKLSFVGKCMQLEITKLSQSGLRKTKAACFLLFVGSGFEIDI